MDHTSCPERNYNRAPLESDIDDPYLSMSYEWSHHPQSWNTSYSPTSVSQSLIPLSILPEQPAQWDTPAPNSSYPTVQGTTNSFSPSNTLPTMITEHHDVKLLQLRQQSLPPFSNIFPSSSPSSSSLAGWNRLPDPEFHEVSYPSTSLPIQPNPRGSDILAPSAPEHPRLSIDEQRPTGGSKGSSEGVVESRGETPVNHSARSASSLNEVTPSHTPRPAKSSTRHSVSPYARSTQSVSKRKGSNGAPRSRPERTGDSSRRNRSASIASSDTSIEGRSSLPSNSVASIDSRNGSGESSSSRECSISSSNNEVRVSPSPSSVIIAPHTVGGNHSRLTTPTFLWLSAVLDPKRRKDKSQPTPSGKCELCETVCQRPGTLQQHVLCQHRQRLARKVLMGKPFDMHWALMYTILQVTSNREQGPIEAECAEFRQLLADNPSGLISVPSNAFPRLRERLHTLCKSEKWKGVACPYCGLLMQRRTTLNEHMVKCPSNKSTRKPPNKRSTV